MFRICSCIAVCVCVCVRVCTEVKYSELCVTLKCRDVRTVHRPCCKHCSYVIYLAQVYFMRYNCDGLFVILCVCVGVSVPAQWCGIHISRISQADTSKMGKNKFSPWFSGAVYWRTGQLIRWCTVSHLKPAQHRCASHLLQAYAGRLLQPQWKIVVRRTVIFGWVGVCMTSQTSH
jgi:hypothetical protein